MDAPSSCATGLNPRTPHPLLYNHNVAAQLIAKIRKAHPGGKESISVYGADHNS